MIQPADIRPKCQRNNKGNSHVGLFQAAESRSFESIPIVANHDTHQKASTRQGSPPSRIEIHSHDKFVSVFVR